MRTRARVDLTQLEIVQALRKCGAQVLHLHTIGKGCPDILIRLPNGELHLCEIKNGNRKWKLEPEQVKFHSEWGPIAILDSVESAIIWVNTSRMK
jgi:hypothetical protein